MHVVARLMQATFVDLSPQRLGRSQKNGESRQSRKLSRNPQLAPNIWTGDLLESVH